MNRSSWPVLALLVFASCGDTPDSSGAEPAPLSPIAAPVQEVELAETPALDAPAAGSRSAEAAPTAALPVGPTFPGLAETPGGPAPRIADIEITLQRTHCYGSCPMYTVRISGSGAVRYEGKKHVLRTEPADAQIDPARLEPILRELEAMDFMRHKHRCRILARDTPGTGVKLLVGKTFRRHGDDLMGRECGQDATAIDTVWHSNLDRIGRLLDELVQSEQWIGTQEQRDALQRDK